MAPRTTTTGMVYRDDAAELMAAAARTIDAEPVRVSRPNAPAAPQVRPETRRPLPYPEPEGVNDNPDEPFDVEPLRRRMSLPRLIARILIAPLYIAVAVGAFAIIGLFAKVYFGF